MDKKELQLLKSFHQKFSQNDFDETDVYNFLILIRESVRGFNAVRELGDFIAHREKSKGAVKEYLEENERILNNLGKINAVLKIQDVFTFKEIRNGINSIFLKNGLKKISNECINNIILCVISILQDTKIIGKEKREIGKLSFAISQESILLMANIKILHNGSKVNVTFQVLSCKNTYENITPRDNHDTPQSIIDDIVQVINVNKKLKIVVPIDQTK